MAKTKGQKPAVQKPGEKAKVSGQYEIVGPKGGHTGREVTVVQGEPLPPTPKPGQGLTLVDKTKHSPKKKGK